MGKIDRKKIAAVSRKIKDVTQALNCYCELPAFKMMRCFFDQTLSRGSKARG